MHLVKNHQWTYDNIWEFVICERDNYTTGYLLDHVYFENYFKMIAADLSKQQALISNSKAIQQLKFTWNLNQTSVTTMYFITDITRKW